jgi:glutamate/tyrosine decarboxylase-like PLP-dependent enzyme
MLGLGRNRLTRVPVDSQGRMRADKLPKLSAPAILCLQAGNVNSGAFDPFAELCAAGREAGAWIHVDGAFGLWARASQALAPLARGLELADSWATDAHKWLNVPYDSGLAFVRDAQALQSAMAITAEYLPTQGRAPQSLRLHARAFQARPRHRDLCRAQEPRQRRTRAHDRAQLRPGATLRRGTEGRWLRDPE